MGWKYAVGKKGVNRVTVYERRDATSIFVVWFDDDGRHREALRTTLGKPVTDRDFAKDIAVTMSRAQEQKRNAEARELLGMGAPKRLKALLEQLHRVRGEAWSESHRRDQKRAREFWESRLGDAELHRVTAALVEEIVAKETTARVTDKVRRDWSPRTQGKFLRYIVDAFYFARIKLKWITEKDDLSAVTMPRKAPRGAAYTLPDAKKLLPALEEVSTVAGWMGYVAAMTGRRLSAIRFLRKSAVEMHDDYAVLKFPATTDKARRAGEAVVAGDALRLTRTLMETPGPYVAGVKPTDLHTCREWIEEAERRAEIPHIPYRAWHGLKRLWATRASGMRGWDKQSGTLAGTLSGVYVQDEIEPKRELAVELARDFGNG